VRRQRVDHVLIERQFEMAGSNVPAVFFSDMCAFRLSE